MLRQLSPVQVFRPLCAIYGELELGCFGAGFNDEMEIVEYIVTIILAVCLITLQQNKNANNG